jgi:hypothetical protein
VAAAAGDDAAHVAAALVRETGDLGQAAERLLAQSPARAVGGPALETRELAGRFLTAGRTPAAGARY